MSHVFTEHGAGLAITSALGYVSEFRNALSDHRLRGGPEFPLPHGLPSLDTFSTEEDKILGEWLVSHDDPYRPHDRTRYHFGTAAAEDAFFEDWRTPFWYFFEQLRRYALPQTKNTRRRKVVSHRT